MIKSVDFVRLQFLNLLQARRVEGCISLFPVTLLPLPYSPEVQEYMAEQQRTFQAVLKGIFSTTPEEIGEMSRQFTERCVEVYGQEAVDEARKWWDIPEPVRDLAMSLDGRFTDALHIVRKLPASDNTAAALDLLIAVLKTKHYVKDAAYFEGIQEKSAMNLRDIPQTLLSEAYTAFTEENYDLAHRVAYRAFCAWIILRSDDLRVRAKARESWHLMGEVLEKKENYLLARSHWRKISDHVREGLANLRYAARISTGEEAYDDGVDGEVSWEQRALESFTDAARCFEKAGFRSLEEFVMGVASAAREKKKYTEADFFLEALTHYFHSYRIVSERGDFVRDTLHVVALLDQVELRSLVGDPKQVIETLYDLRSLARVLRNPGLEAMAKKEIEAIRDNPI